VTGPVVDSSIALSWCFEDEATPQTEAVFELVRREGAIVPGLWHLELGNVLLQAERRGRIVIGMVMTRFDRIGELPIETDTETVTRAWREILALARAENLTTYDATYLELAARRNASLASKDNALRAAARRLKIRVLP
jgi:predicted nucleic acid-binding protein